MTRAQQLAAKLKERYVGTVPTSQAAAELLRLDAQNSQLLDDLRFASQFMVAGGATEAEFRRVERAIEAAEGGDA